MTREEQVLASSAVSKNWQTHVVREVRAVLGLKKGNRLQWVLKRSSAGIEIVVRKDK